MHAALKLKAPNLSTTFTTGYKRDGFCENDDTETGVKITPSIKASMDFTIEQAYKGDKTPTVLYQKPDIFSVDIMEFPESCLHVELPEGETKVLKKQFEDEEEKKRLEEEEEKRRLNPEGEDVKVKSSDGGGEEASKEESGSLKMGPMSVYCIYALVAMLAVVPL
ncbi:hypothetical protein BJ508DRAFT_64036 [Ascobolus immersus RN42]|uniref:Uncharacterized protein n=1 Tax=Ascobolus immersus RN42 TaxID=1160509 RepID=A0A3N4IP89_ASCIM|nr:hypothetical protein BJ508DRAFT_64036 [Ascobolus immersus RN42]